MYPFLDLVLAPGYAYGHDDPQMSLNSIPDEDVTPAFGTELHFLKPLSDAFLSL
jgi:hypothetical protein